MVRLLTVVGQGGQYHDKDRYREDGASGGPEDEKQQIAPDSRSDVVVLVDEMRFALSKLRQQHAW